MRKHHVLLRATIALASLVGVAALLLAGCTHHDLLIVGYSGQPIAGAKVVGISPSMGGPGPNGGPSTTSNAKGQAAIPWAVQETAWISVYKDGFDPVEHIDIGNHPERPIVIRMNKAQPRDLRALLGKEVTLVGVAEPWMAGPALHGDDFFVFLAVDAWPGEVVMKTVRVTGRLEEHHDLPVFIAKPTKDGGWPPQGIPVPEGTDLKEASKRFVIVNPKWELVEESHKP